MRSGHSMVLQNGGIFVFGGGGLEQVSFAEYHLFYRALLQKRPMILRSLLIVAGWSRGPMGSTTRSGSLTRRAGSGVC